MKLFLGAGLTAIAALLLCFILVGVSARPGSKKTCGYESCPATPSDKINIHLTPHTHDDVGWLKTPDQYYYGSRSNIQRAGIQYIFDSVVAALSVNPERRFIIVEAEFFFKWWDEQTAEMQDQVRALVEEGRLEFINGAWSMNDEATTHYQSIIDQFSLGLRRLDEAFGKCGRPRIGWQIDPFGHSREQASIFAQMGYDGEFFARMDFVDKNKRMDEKAAEMLWRSSDILGESSDILTHMMYHHYSAPSGFCFDILCNDEPIIDGKSYDNNVGRRVDDFINYVREISSKYQTNNIMVPMGDDFQYQNALVNFKNMDKLIKYTNARQANGSDVNIVYSTPSCYIKSLHEHKTATWPTKTQDFFPYASDSHSYWTGYFTSRPTVKRFERDGNHFLQVCKQLSAFAKLNSESDQSHLYDLKNIMGIMQHHDAITGTEKQAVAKDYDRTLYDGILSCGENAKKALRIFTNYPQAEFESCLSLNTSSCALAESTSKFMVTLYNPLSSKVTEYVRVPVRGEYIVYTEDGDVVPYQMLNVPDGVKNIPNRSNKANNEVVFRAEVDKLATFNVIKTGDSESYTAPEKQIQENEDKTIEVSNNKIKLIFNESGHLSEVTVDGLTQKLSQDFFYYKGMTGNGRSSGAYVFRPDGIARQIAEKVEIKVYDGHIVKEVHQKFNDWVSQVIRIYENKDFVEFDWLVGAIPTDGYEAKEVVTRFSSEIESNGVFFTDSNGHEMIRRVRNQREDFTPNLDEKVSSNYYPVTAKIALQDSHTRMVILNDRAQGGSSLEDGQIELMLHRRLLNDDGFGVGEALNESEDGKGLMARGKLYLLLGPTTKQQQLKERQIQQQTLLPLWSFFSNSPPTETKTIHPYVPSVSEFLPESVNLLTVEQWGENQLLLRFENIDEMQDTDFNFQHIFEKFGGKEVRETTLDGSLWLSHMERFKFTAKGDMYSNSKQGAGHEPFFGTRANIGSELRVKFKPLQIRTFIMLLDN